VITPLLQDSAVVAGVRAANNWINNLGKSSVGRIDIRDALRLEI
jgi:hypothetical protein